MQEFSKKNLLSLIFESQSQEIDEFADWKKMRGEVKKFEKINDENNNLVGWNVKGTPILFTCGSDITEFISSHPELIEQLRAKFGNSLKWEQGNLPGCQPRRQMDIKNFPKENGKKVGGRTKKIVTSYTGPETSMGSKEKILRKLNSVIVEKLENPEVTKHLEACSIPPVKGRERSHIDRYSQISNNFINYKTHTFNSYKSAQDFLKSVMMRIKGNTPENLKTYHLARQFNKVYGHWETTKKNKKEYKGLTDIYQLEKYGLAEDNLDVTVAMFFEINGQYTGNMDNKYVWSIKFNTQYGKKLKQDERLGTLTPDKEILITKTAEVEPGTEFNESFTVMDHFSIVSSLYEGMDELVQQIMGMTPKDALKLANIKRKDVEKVNENYISKLIRNVIKENKK